MNILSIGIVNHQELNFKRVEIRLPYDKTEKIINAQAQKSIEKVKKIYNKSLVLEGIINRIHSETAKKLSKLKIKY